MIKNNNGEILTESDFIVEIVGLNENGSFFIVFDKNLVKTGIKKIIFFQILFFNERAAILVAEGFSS